MKKINLNFQPMQLTEYDGVEALGTIGDTAYPFYAQPTLEGIDVMVRCGRIHFNGINRQFRNVSVREKFFSLFDFTQANGLAVHATLRSETMNDADLLELLCTYDAVTTEEAAERAYLSCVCGQIPGKVKFLPDDLELIVTDIVSERYPESATIEKRINDLCLIREELGLESALPKKCLNKEEFEALLEHFAENYSSMDGVSLHQPGSTYWQGASEEIPTAVKVSLAKQELANIISHTLPDCVSKDSPMSGHLGVLSDSCGFEVSLELLSNRAQTSLEQLKGDIVGKVIVLNTLSLPTRSTPISRSIADVGLPECFQRLVNGRHVSEEVYSLVA